MPRIAKSKFTPTRDANAGAARNYRPPIVDPNAVLYRARDAVATFGISRTELYRRLACGDLIGRKVGHSLLIEGDGLRKLKDKLPIATFGKPG